MTFQEKLAKLRELGDFLYKNPANFCAVLKQVEDIVDEIRFEYPEEYSKGDGGASWECEIVVQAEGGFTHTFVSGGNVIGRALNACLMGCNEE